MAFVRCAHAAAFHPRAAFHQSHPRNPAALIQQRRAAQEQQAGRPLTERELLALIANVVADTSAAQWREDVRRRRMTIVNGTGVVHGEHFDLGRRFGLTDQPWDTATSGVHGFAAPPSASPEAQLVQDAIRRGIRDLNRLTDLVFHARHPERRGQPIRPQEQQLVQEWRQIRDQVVRPALFPAGRAAAGCAPFRPRVYASVREALRQLLPLLNRYRGDIPLNSSWGGSSWSPVGIDLALPPLTSGDTSRSIPMNLGPLRENPSAPERVGWGVENPGKCVKAFKFREGEKQWPISK